MIHITKVINRCLSDNKECSTLVVDNVSFSEENSNVADNTLDYNDNLHIVDSAADLHTVDNVAHLHAVDNVALCTENSTILENSGENKERDQKEDTGGEPDTSSSSFSKRTLSSALIDRLINETAHNSSTHSRDHSQNNIAQTTDDSMMESSDQSASQANTDSSQNSTDPENRIAEPVSSVSQSAHAITVLSPSIEKSLQDRNITPRQQPSRLLASRRARGIPGVSSSGDLSKLLTLEEDKELDITSSTTQPENASLDPPLSPNRMSPAMMGRRHSMDSNIGRIRPPTFVRTYRDVKWKRVSKPSKLRQLPQILSTERLVTDADKVEDEEVDSREYISGTHIIRQRVPIFVTSRDPPDPMGRRFSAGDLIPVTGQDPKWALNGKCLVIRDIVQRKIDSATSSDDSSSSNSSPSTSTEDVRISQSSDGSEDEEDHEGYDFSLIDDDDEDDDESHTSGYDDENENVSPDNKSSIKGSASSAPKKVPKNLDLRRLALENTFQKKTPVGDAGPRSTKALPPPNKPHAATSPQIHSAASVQGTNMTAMMLATSGVELAAAMVPATAGANTISQVTQHHIVTTPQTPEHTDVPSLLPISVSASTLLPPQASVNSLPALTLSAVLPFVTSQLVVDSNNDFPSASALALSNSNNIAPKLNGVPPDASQVFPSSSQTSDVSDANNQHHIVQTNARLSGPASSSTRVPIIGALNIQITQNNEQLDPALLSPNIALVPSPTSPSDMPWVMTSTKIADANVFVSSSHPANSNISTRSAHWISPRSVEGTIPINLDDAKAIRVETVSVPTSPDTEPLQFQKVTYSSGYIISSAQWVAPTETDAAESNQTETNAKSELNKQTEVFHTSPTSSKLLQNSDLLTPIKKSRRKYVADKSGSIHRTVLLKSQLRSDSSLSSSTSKSTHKLQESDGHTNHLKQVASEPSMSPQPKTSPRLSKRRFDDKMIVDKVNTTEANLCAQLRSASLSQPSSPTTTKRRFLVEKVQSDPLDTSLCNLNGLSARLDMTFSPTQTSPACVTPDESVDELSQKIDKTDISLQLPSSLQCDKDPSLDSPHVEPVSLIANCSHLEILQSATNAHQDIIPSAVQEQDSHIKQNVDSLQAHHETPTSTPNQELVPQLREKSATPNPSEKRYSSSGSTKLRIDSDDDEKFAKENDVLLQIILTSISNTQEVDILDSVDSGGSTVAIDNKIEQAMDLVKRHLMYAVREEVEILKQQIGEMMDRIGQLEYENSLLRSEAKPETLNKLLQPRLTQPPPQAVLPTQLPTASIAAAPAQQQQPAPSQIQPPQQQQTTASQVGQPPSTT